MLKFNDNESGESPIEVGLYFLLVLLVMSFLMIVMGAFLDTYNVQMLSLSLSSSWSQTEMAKYLNYINWTYRIPIIFVIIVMIWGVRAVIRKHTYTTAQNGQQIINPDEEF